MQIGLNNDVEFQSERYHIQTEDLGLKTCQLVSQIFRGGQIVDTIEVNYAKHIKGIDHPDQRDDIIRKRMRALHKLCYRNIHSGKYLEPTSTIPEGLDLATLALKAKEDVETPAEEQLDSADLAAIDSVLPTPEPSEIEPSPMAEQPEEDQTAVYQEPEEEPSPPGRLEPQEIPAVLDRTLTELSDEVPPAGTASDALSQTLQMRLSPADLAQMQQEAAAAAMDTAAPQIFPPDDEIAAEPVPLPAEDEMATEQMPSLAAEIAEPKRAFRGMDVDPDKDLARHIEAFLAGNQH